MPTGYQIKNPNTWQLKAIDITNALANLNAMQPRFDRGFTGHERLYVLGLINMNERVYDPVLGRGNSVSRIGWQSGGIQKWTQNILHYIIDSPYLYSPSYSEPYFYSGYNNLFSLY